MGGRAMAPHPANVHHQQGEYLHQCRWPIPGSHCLFHVLRYDHCEEVGFVSRVHLLSGEVRSVTTALKVVEEVQEEVQEIEDD